MKREEWQQKAVQRNFREIKGKQGNSASTSQSSVLLLFPNVSNTFFSAGRDVKPESGVEFKGTSKGRKEEEWHMQQTGSDGKPTKIYSPEERSGREEAATPPVVTTDAPKL